MLSSTNYESYLRQASSTYKYDVFLSFRGDDTRGGFTSYLCYALCMHSVKTFMDLILEKGEKLDQLLQKIVESRISIVVFSENFASSEWCLDELLKIFQERTRRGHDVLPVFYKVDPSELRRQDKGKTKDHMDKHRSKYGYFSPKVTSWSNAIMELGRSSGWTYSSDQGKTEVELILEIVKFVLIKLHGQKTVQERSLMSSPSNLYDIISTVNADMNQVDRGNRRLVYEPDSGCIKGITNTDTKVENQRPGQTTTAGSVGINQGTNSTPRQGLGTIYNYQSLWGSLPPATTQDTSNTSSSNPNQVGITSSFRFSYTPPNGATNPNNQVLGGQRQMGDQGTTPGRNHQPWSISITDTFNIQPPRPPSS